MSTSTSVCLGNQRYVSVCEWKGDKRVDVREWDGNIPLKKGVSLSLLRWKQFLEHIDSIDEALSAGKGFQAHLGGNVFCTIKESNPCVDIRQYWKPNEDVVPCKKGLCLRPLEYIELKKNIGYISAALPELSSIVPCSLQSTHQNQLGYLQCPECNPNDHQNWIKEASAQLTNDELLRFSRRLGSDWQLFAIQLGFDLTQTEDLKQRYPCALETLLYVLLYKWHDIAKHDGISKWLLAGAFSRTRDNLTARELLGKDINPAHLKTIRPYAITLEKIRHIKFGA